MLRPGLRYALALAAAVFAIAGAARAQSPWPSSTPGPAAAQPSPWPSNAAPPAAGKSSSPFDGPPAGVNSASPFDQGPAAQGAPPGGAAGFGQPAAPSGAQEACARDFAPLRQDVEKRGQAIRTASERHATPQEACNLFGSFITANTKMVKYAEKNAAQCGIPPQVIGDMKKGAEQAGQIRARVCMAAKQQQQGGGAAAAPSLGDALGASQIPSASNVKPGRGTFDTLTGTPLGAK